MMKRIFDLTVSVVGLTIILIPMIIISLIVSIITLESPFFTQKRLGKGQKPFKIYKLKTLSNTKDDSGNLLPDDDRKTRIGTFLRKTSIDELPQLINVVIGNMSLVGPRPLLAEYKHSYSDFQNQRHLVKPGITGWCQVNGRDSLSWEEKFELDCWYVQHNCFKIDIFILYLTTIKVVGMKNTAPKGKISVERFDQKNIQGVEHNGDTHT